MTQLERPNTYNGLEGLEPREDAVLGVLGLGLKKIVLQNWKRDHPEWNPPENALTPGGKLMMIPITSRFFIRMARGQGAPGSTPMDRHRPMLDGFEKFNLGESDNGGVGPAGKTSFYGFLPAGTPDDYVQINRRAQKLGAMVKKPGSRYKEFKRAPDTQPAPGGNAECRGDGKKASRWMKGPGGQFGWHEIECLNHDCPFADVCPPTSRLLVHSREDKCGESLLLRFESPTSIHTAQNLTGFFDRLRRELDSFKLSHELYGLPIRMEVEMVSKGAGPIVVGGRTRQMSARRFPVVKFGTQVNVVQFRQNLARMLETGGGVLSLPAAPPHITTGPEEVDSMADFNPDPPAMPRLELVPPNHAVAADVIDVIEVTPGDSDAGVLAIDYPGAVMIEAFLGYMPRKKKDSDEATRLLLQASCIKGDEKWFNLSGKAPREIWTAALHAMKKETMV